MAKRRSLAFALIFLFLFASRQKEKYKNRKLLANENVNGRRVAKNISDS